MILVYLILCVLGFAFFGFAGAGAFVTGMASRRLRRYQYRYLGLRDDRFILARFFRQVKFAMFQPVFCVFLALAIICVVSLLISPLAFGSFSGAEMKNKALKVGTFESRIFEFTEWLNGSWLVGFLMGLTLVLLLINLIWPALPILSIAPRVRRTIRNALIFLTTLSAFSFVSGSNINSNRAMITSQLRSSIEDNNEEVMRLNSQSVADRIVTEAIEILSDDELQRMAKLVVALGSANVVEETAGSIGREAGSKMTTSENGATKRINPMDEVKDWPTLEKRLAQSSNSVKRAELVSKAAREAMFAGIDEIARDLSGRIGGGGKAKVVLSAFFTGMSESVANLCQEIGSSRKLASVEEIRRSIDSEFPNRNPNRVLSEWLDSLPAGSTPGSVIDEKHLARQIGQISDDIEIKRIRAATKADDAAKAAKAAKTVLRFIF